MCTSVCSLVCIGELLTLCVTDLLKPPLDRWCGFLNKMLRPRLELMVVEMKLHTCSRDWRKDEHDVASVSLLDAVSGYLGLFICSD